MIASLRGELAQVGKDHLVVDVAGVGYLVLASQRHLAELPAIGGTVRIFTHLVVREDALTLVGFPSPEERELFLLLHGVSGIGAKTALGVLSALSVPEVVAAVVGQDPKRLAKAPGVGKKTAERIVLELREKLEEWRPARGGDAVAAARAAARPASLGGAPVSEAELALLALGYGEDEAAEAIAQAGAQSPPGATVEDLIRASLGILSRF